MAETKDNGKAENGPPDGGYGWVIVFAIILINSSLLTLVQCFGIIFKDDFTSMGISAAKTSFLLHLHSSIYCCFGFFGSPFLKKYGFRLTAFVGASLMCLGILLSSFATSYGFLIFSISILIGLGQGILMPATYLATYTYFNPQQRLRKGINELSKDKTLLCVEKQWEDVSNDDRDDLKMKIQEIFLKVGEDFLERKCSVLKYRRQSFSNCVFRDGRLQLRPLKESTMTVISSTAARSRTRFKLILYIMKKIQTLLETNTKLTKRELYYQLKTLVSDQRVIDRIINAISSLLNVGMWALNIIAQKGLVYGNLKILLSSGETLNCNIPGTLIPQDINEIVEIHSIAFFILVVEKESIFYKLIEEGLPERLTRPFIMITGKGFPDLNTQLFLKKLWMVMSIPVFIMVDADPHGINIMLNYRFGSVNNAHVSHHLAVPNAKWLGVYPSEVINLNLTKELLSERELKLVEHLLRTPYVDCHPRIVSELKVLLEKKYKAEIEGLIKSDTFLSDVYLPNKFFTHNFI